MDNSCCYEKHAGESQVGSGGGVVVTNIKDGLGDRVLTVGFLPKRWWVGLALHQQILRMLQALPVAT